MIKRKLFWQHSVIYVDEMKKGYMQVIKLGMILGLA